MCDFYFTYRIAQHIGIDKVFVIIIKSCIDSFKATILLPINNVEYLFGRSLPDFSISNEKHRRNQYCFLLLWVNVR